MSPRSPRPLELWLWRHLPGKTDDGPLEQHDVFRVPTLRDLTGIALVIAGVAVHRAGRSHQGTTAPAGEGSGHADEPQARWLRPETRALPGSRSASFR